MNVRECMTESPTTIAANESILSAAKTMRECDIGAVPVVVDDRLVGVLTDRDIVVRAAALGLELEDHQAQEIMSVEPKTVTPDAQLEEAADTMAEAKVRRLPVVDDGTVVGVVSLGDMAVAHKGHDEPCAATLQHISEPVGPKCIR